MKQFTDIYTESGTAATFTLGYGQLTGKLILTSSTMDQGQASSWGSFSYDGATGTLRIGDSQMGLSGKLVIGPSGTSSQSILLDAATNTVEAGGDKVGNGKLSLKNRTGAPVILVSAETCSLTVGCKNTATDDHTGGQIFVSDTQGVQTAVLDGRNAKLSLGAQQAGGSIVINDDNGVEAIKIIGALGLVELPKAILDGNNGNLSLGGPGADGDIVIKNDKDIETIKITGSSGDIEFLNADLAEEFDVAPGALSEVRPGMVVVLDEEGCLVPCAQPYDSSVVGILAGAGNYRPGIVLDKRSAPNRRPVTLVGKVFCWVDAQQVPVRAGDMLTTSANPGHAMRASDRLRSAGAVIGKALRPLLSGTGLIPVLVKPN